MKLKQLVTTVGYYCELGGWQHDLTASCGCITAEAMLVLRSASRPLAKEKSFSLKTMRKGFNFWTFKTLFQKKEKKKSVRTVKQTNWEGRKHLKITIHFLI